jgi:hypothetical protein
MTNKRCLRRDAEWSGPRMVRGNISAFVGATEENNERIRNRNTTPSTAYLGQKVESSNIVAFLFLSVASCCVYLY